MLPTWILETCRFANDCDVATRLGYLLAERGRSYRLFDYVPFGGTDWRRVLDVDGPSVFLGSVNAVADIRARGISVPEPFAWYEPARFGVEAYRGPLGDMALNGIRSSALVPFGTLLRMADGRGRLFVRPEDNEKSFPGQVVEQELLPAFFRHVVDKNDGVTLATTVLVAPIRELEREWRTVIVRGRAVAGSQYRDGTAVSIAPDCPAEVLAFAERAAARYAPAPVFVLDVCRTTSGELKVVELGPFNYAGLYLCDLRAVLEAVDEHVDSSTRVDGEVSGRATS